MKTKWWVVLLLVAGCHMQTQAQWKYSWTEMFIPKIAPLTLFDPYTPGISLGLEFQPMDQAALQLEYNIPFEYLSFFNFNEGKIDHNTRRFRGEFRIYPGCPDESAAWYLAGEGFVVTERYRRENSLLLRNEQLYSYTRSTITRDVFGGAVKAGYQFVVNYYLMVDVFAGLGVRQVTIQHRPEEFFPSAALFDERWGGDQREGSFIRPHLALGIRLGWSLYSRY